MKVVSNTVTIGLDGERYVKGIPFECDDATAKRLIAQGTVELVRDVKVSEAKVPVVENVPEPEPEKLTEQPAEEFEKVGGRWRKK